MTDAAPVGPPGRLLPRKRSERARLLSHLSAAKALVGEEAHKRRLPNPPFSAPAGWLSGRGFFTDGQMAPGRMRNCKGRPEPTCENPCQRRRPAYEKPSPGKDKASRRRSRITSTSISRGRASSGLKTTAALGVGSFFKISWNAHASPVFFRYSDGVFACVNFTLKKSPSVFWRPSRFTRCRTKKRHCAWPRRTLDSFLRAIWARTVGATRRQLLRPVLQTALVRGIFWTRLALTRGQPRARQHRIGGARSA